MTADYWNRYIGSDLTPAEYKALGGTESSLVVDLADLWDDMSPAEIRRMAADLAPYLEGRRMEFTIREAYRILRRLGYPKGHRTVWNAIRQHGMGRKSGHVWLITFHELRRVADLKGMRVTEEQWKEAIGASHDA